MASLRVSGCRLASSSRAAAPAAARRSYASQASAPAVADFKVSNSSSGIKLATLDEGAPTSAITVAIKAGSRYESQPGLAHVLKNFVFKGTNKRSALRIIRETELLGGVLSASLTREHLFLTAECMRGDEPYFAEILGDVLTQSKFAPHEYHEEVVPSVAVEYEQALQTPEVIALDLAHQLAFRRGLGNSLFATPHLEVPLNSAVGYARSAFSATDRIAVLASGVDGGFLNTLVGDFFTGSSASASASGQAAIAQSSKTQYFGGELRVAATGHGAASTGSLLIGFQGGAQDQPEYAVLKALLGGESSLKWASGATPLSQLAGTNVGGRATVRAFNLPYSDAGLFGVFVQAPTEQVGSLAQKAMEAVKNLTSGSIKDEQLKAAIARAKFAAASALESRQPRQEIIGAQILESSSVTSLADAFAALDKVTASKIQEAAKAVLKSKPTVVAVGDTHKLPYADELGL